MLIKFWLIILKLFNLSLYTTVKVDEVIIVKFKLAQNKSFLALKAFPNSFSY